MELILKKSIILFKTEKAVLITAPYPYKEYTAWLPNTFVKKIHRYTFEIKIPSSFEVKLILSEYSKETKISTIRDTVSLSSIEYFDLSVKDLSYAKTHIHKPKKIEALAHVEIPLELLDEND